ncbi:hypothetical protein B4O97_12455 [Marispirochaeta aestuarii]|uniref:UVR domain-containing protein n=1 Tax=Marispirochaeta aestuarii TaxID=1963862 RepID=A0A1Y1RWA0_9SPIO|nr:UvrB/UvrC motif-containing protein [Marispirochaeta aestuarii]ORC34447.1 hypothetical protein B4O97_12455 [Marispirochaeta aestuarii]
MKCELCNENDAVIHIQQIVGNEAKEIHLCEKCAHENGISSNSDKIELSLNELLNGLIDFSSRPRRQDTCPTCGGRLKDFRKSGMVGCADCYTTFRDEIVSYLEESVGTVKHAGKYPKKLQAYKTLLVDKEILKKRLEEAVAGEDYETAAGIRDRIQSIEAAEGGEG